MHWIYLFLHSVLAFIVIGFGCAYGFTIQTIFFVSLLSAVSLRFFSLKDVDKIDWQGVADYKSLYWHIEGLYLLRCSIIWLLPYALLFLIGVNQVSFFNDFFALALKNNQSLTQLTITWFPIKSDVANAMVQIKGDAFFQDILLLSTISFVSFLLGTILHLIAFQPFMRMRSRIDKSTLPRAMAFCRIIIIPIILLALASSLYVETRTIFFLEMSGSVVAFAEGRFLAVMLSMLFFPVALPVLGSYVAQSFIRFFK